MRGIIIPGSCERANLDCNLGYVTHLRMWVEPRHPLTKSASCCSYPSLNCNPLPMEVISIHAKLTAWCKRGFLSNFVDKTHVFYHCYFAVLSILSSFFTQLPFSLLPLLHATSSEKIMGQFKNSLYVH